MLITVDRLGSVTANASLSTTVQLSSTIPNRVGTVIVGRVLEDKEIYNQLEDKDGTLHRLNRGDIVAGALGSRRALRGHSGDISEQITVGDHLRICSIWVGSHWSGTSSSPDVGAPLTIEVLGAPIEDGEVVNIEEGTVRPAHFLQEMPPVVAFAGTCMHSGKTQATAAFIAGAVAQGLKVVELKLTGVALQRDVRKMQRQGAAEVYTLNDAGLPSTCVV